MDREHFKKVGQDHLKALDDYEDWMAEEALHSWAADIVQEAVAEGDDEFAERVRLDGRTTDKKAIRKAFKDRIAGLA